MFIKLTTVSDQPLLLDVERIVSVCEHKNRTEIEYAKPKEEGFEIECRCVQESAAEILELIDEKQGANL